MGFIVSRSPGLNIMDFFKNQKNNPMGSRRHRLLFVILCIVLGTALFLASLRAEETRETLISRCPRCQQSIPYTLPPGIHGEPDRFLCRWSTQPGNPYKQRFVTCPRCGLTFLIQDFQNGDLLAKTPESHPGKISAEPGLTLYSSALVTYTADHLPPRLSVRGLWDLVCALHHEAVPYPDPSWNQSVTRAWRILRRFGLTRWPVWRWYESLAYFFENEFRKHHQPQSALLASDFFRKIGHLSQAITLGTRVQSHIQDRNILLFHRRLMTLLNLEKEIRLAMRSKIMQYLNQTNPCEWTAQGVLYILTFSDFDNGEHLEFLKHIQQWLACPNHDPALFVYYIEPLLRTAWLQQPSLRPKIEKFLATGK